MRCAAVILFVSALVATGCAGDDDEATGTSTSAPQTTASATSAPTSAPTGSPPPSTIAGAEQPCIYRKNLLVTVESINDLIPDPNDPNDQPEIPGVTPIEDYQTLTNVDTAGGDFDFQGFTADDFGALTSGSGQPLFLYDVGDQDPLTIATTVQNTYGIDASPVLGMSSTGHWSMAPGSDFTDVSTAPLPMPVFTPGTAASAAVIDTGYSETEGGVTPSWLFDRVDAAVPGVDDDQAVGAVEGHGKFVASVIVQQEPQTFVRVAAMRPVNLDHFYNVDSEIESAAQAGYLGDELQFFSANQRLLHPAGVAPDEVHYSVLNLSVGAWACPGLTRSALALRGAIDAWTAGTDKAPVVAAAGNHKQVPPDDAMFLPGQDSTLALGVESLDVGGTRLSDFSNLGKSAAVGECLLGIRVDTQPGTFWSGTSFATAVMSGFVATNGLPTVSTPPTAFFGERPASCPEVTGAVAIDTTSANNAAAAGSTTPTVDPVTVSLSDLLDARGQ